MDKSSINVFEVKPVRKDIGFKISAADVFNQFLYIGDEKGNIHFYPIRVGDSEIIPKSQNQTSKNISKHKIDKILCYPQISMVLVLSGETLYAVDSALRKSDPLASKISDFAINQNFAKEGETVNQSVVAITRKKEGFVFVYNPTSKKLEDIKVKFSVSEVPSCVAYIGGYVIIATKKDYQSLNSQKSFALKKSPLQAKFPFVKAVGASQVLILSDDIGLIMSPQFDPKLKDSVLINRPVSQISLAGNYCFVLCDNVLQVYLNYDKKFSLVQQLPINMAKGITNQRPFIYNRDDLYFLYEIPYETQIKSLLEKCRVEDAISLLIQNIGPDNQQKVQELKINAVWPLLKKLLFDKVKEQIRNINFDIRQIILLYPELVGLQIPAMRGPKPSKTMATLIIQFLSEKAQKGKDEQIDLKKRSKLFLKEILTIKRQIYLSEGNKVKKRDFYVSKNSLVQNGKFEPVTPEQMLQIIDFTLVKQFFEMNTFKQLENFLLANPVIYCQKQYPEFQQMFKKNPKLIDVPALKPRLYTAFEKYDEAFQNWQKVAESSQQDSDIKVACQQAVVLLTKFQDRSTLSERMSWILRLKPEIAMNFFVMVPLNFIQPDQIIKKFQAQKQWRYLELYLQTIVIRKNTEVQAYHTKLMLLYLNSLFQIHPKDSKQQGKSSQFQEKLAKFRKLEKNSNARYASEPILKKIQKCEWLLQDEIYFYSRQKRHQDALRRYISKSMSKEAEQYCQLNGDQTLTIYFRMLLTMYRSFESSKNNSALLLKKDILIFLKEHAGSPELDPLVVLELIPDDWMLNDLDGVGGIYQFLDSSITHTLHEKRTNYTAKHLSEMDLLNAEYELVKAKRAYLRFTIKKKCCICNGHIADKVFVVYPNANVCHQGCVKKDKNTVCPVTKQDFEKTFKY